MSSPKEKYECMPRNVNTSFWVRVQHYIPRFQNTVTSFPRYEKQTKRSKNFSGLSGETQESQIKLPTQGLRSSSPERPTSLDAFHDIVVTELRRIQLPIAADAAVSPRALLQPEWWGWSCATACAGSCLYFCFYGTIKVAPPTLLPPISLSASPAFKRRSCLS